jgi:hypothetical protein
MFSGFYSVIFSKLFVFESFLGLTMDSLRLEHTVNPRLSDKKIVLAESTKPVSRCSGSCSVA